MIAFIFATFTLLGLMLLTFWLGTRAGCARLDTGAFCARCLSPVLKDN